MNGHTDFDTSRMLKEAGFQQPPIKTGQVWYSRSGHPSIIVRRWDKDSWIACQIGSGVVSPPFTGEELVKAYYAPTAQDICENTRLIATQIDVGEWTAGLLWFNRFERYTRTTDSFETQLGALADAWINLKNQEDIWVEAN